MPIPTQKTTLWLAAVCLAGLVSAAALWTALAEDQIPTIEKPTISKSGTNFVVGITNGTNTAYYEVYHTPVLEDPAYPWTLLVVGAQGQTNFTFAPGANPHAFFFVGVGNDWDGDGTPNSQDANPSSTNIGTLAITIDSPTNGASLY